MPGPPILDATTAQTLREIVAKGAMPPLVLVVDDCRVAYERMRARGVEFTQEPVDRYGSVDASFRDPSGNGWKMIEARGAAMNAETSKWIRQIPPLAVHRLYGDGDRQLRCPVTGDATRLGDLLAAAPARLLLFTGLYMFVLPYATKWQSRTDGRLEV